MPEGPEVRLMKNIIKDNYEGTILEKIIIHSGLYKKILTHERWATFKKRLPSKIVRVENHGKYLYLILKNNYVLRIVLNLTGHVQKKCFHYCRLEMITSKGSFFIQDARTFASLDFLTIHELQKELHELGPDPLVDKDSVKAFTERLKKHDSQKIGIALINQKVVAGIGNYMRCEMLYCAKISPYRLVKDITNEEFKKMFQCMNKLFKRIYKSHVTYGDFKSYDFQVYGKTTTPKGEEVVRSKMETTRNMYWVPGTQK